jgi:hypothetical protein
MCTYLRAESTAEKGLQESVVTAIHLTQIEIYGELQLPARTEMKWKR